MKILLQQDNCGAGVKSGLDLRHGDWKLIRHKAN